MNRHLTIIILAAGEGKRMKSCAPKVLHEICARPLIAWVVKAARSIKPDRICVVVGRAADAVRAAAGQGLVFAEQNVRRGSGHALMQALRVLPGLSGDILVLCGDAPLIERQTLAGLVRTHRRERNAATVLTAEIAKPRGYGRIVRGPDGAVERIVEERDASAGEKNINEINSGMYCFDARAVSAALPRIGTRNASGEYYLTDALDIIRRAGGRIGAVVTANAQEALGINTRAELAQAAEHARMRVSARLMAAGVTIIDPANSYISPEVRIGRDAVILPGCVIEGASVIGAGARIGPYAVVKDARIGKGAQVRASFLLGARVGDSAMVGPYAHLRPGTVLERGARVGNFSETKNAHLGRGSKVNHLSYIGDARLGTGVNVGAGTITCNYDGTRKHRTIIGDGAFIGSNTNLVAPVRVGPRAVIGAGSTITESVPAGSLAIARARQINKRRAQRAVRS